MKRIVKQIVAILIAVAFVSSIIFFIPQVPNNTPISYTILAPNSLILPNSSFYSTSPGLFSGINVSNIGGIGQSSVSSIIANTNTTNLLQLTNLALSSSGFNYTESNGRLICVSSNQLVESICDNATYSWTLLYDAGNGSLAPYDNSLNVSLEAIKLKSISQSENFYLIYYNPLASQSTGGSGIPHFTG